MENSDSDSTEGSRLIATFSLGETLYGIDAMRIQEVVRAGVITAIPHAMEYVLGIINLRGKIVTIIDVQVKLGQPRQIIDVESRILILNWQDELVGIVVESVADVIVAECDNCASPPANLDSIQASFLKCVYQGQKRIAILDVDAALAIPTETKKIEGTIE